MINGHCGGVLPLGVALSLALSGCQVPGAAGGKTQAERLQRFYRQLSGGRFSVIADFEDPQHMQLFQISSSTPQARAVLDLRKGRVETGRACLAFTTASPADTLVISNAAATSWYLKRDWRPYNVLMLSILSPEPMEIEVGIGAGPAETREFFTATRTLETGWNNIVVDLAEVGEVLLLDDIQEIRLRTKSATKMVTMHLDDIVTADFRVQISGDSQNKSGGLYVEQVGERLRVGAGGRFELVFAKGRIVQWFNLESDPNRLRNLVERGTLGPRPMSIEGGEPWEDFSRWGTKSEGRHRVIEANSVRAVIDTRREFFNDPHAPAEGRPFYSVRYAIYPTGQVYAQVKSELRGSAWRPALSLAVELSSGATEPAVTTGRTKMQAGDVPWAWVRIPEAGSGLLFAVKSEGGGKVTVHAESPRKRLLLLWSDLPADEAFAGTYQRDVHFWLSSGAAADGEVPAARALDYLSGVPVTVEIGGLGSIEVGKETVAELVDGCISVRTYEGRVRMLLDGRKRTMFSPCISVEGVGEAKPWIYVNHLIHSEYSKTPDGAIVFQLPGEVKARTEVEVLTAAQVPTVLDSSPE